MSDTWFVSDTHFGHANIIEFQKDTRPYRTISEHDDALIELWNSTIKPDDTVWHLGDFALGGVDTIHRTAPKLHGHIRLVLGNHDRHTAALATYFDRVAGAVFQPVGSRRDKVGILLTHVPAHPKGFSSRANLNVHGHNHKRGGEDKDLRYFNVNYDFRGGGKDAFVHKDVIVEYINKVLL